MCYPIGAAVADRFVVEAALQPTPMSYVFRARDEMTGLPCALKISRRTTPTARERLARERSIQETLKHPRVPHVIGGGDLSDGHGYLATPWIDGLSLDQLCRGTPRAWPDALKTIRALAEPLVALHALGIIHRDIKPSNVILPRAPIGYDYNSPVLIDFGVARTALVADHDAIVRMSPVAFSGISGTLEYMAPEQLLGRWEGYSTDVFGLGALFFELLTGRPPMGVARTLTKARPSGSDQPTFIIGEYALRRITESIIVPADLAAPPQVTGLLDAMLQHDPSRRPQSMQEILNTLLTIDESP